MPEISADSSVRCQGLPGRLIIEVDLLAVIDDAERGARSTLFHVGLNATIGKPGAYAIG